jgi:hypothetical protein
MNWVEVNKGKLVVAAAAMGLLVPATIAVAAPGDRRPPPVAVSFERSFTPAQADPRLAAAFSRRPALGSDFKFTPAASSRRPSQLRVAVRARAATTGQAAVRARDAAAQTAASGVTLTPASYNLGVAVGWNRFAVSGDVSKAQAASPALGSREGAVVGVSYNLKRFTGRVAASAERPSGKVAPALIEDSSYAVDVGGAFNISSRVAVTGGVRYRIDRDKLAPPTDQRRDSQAVYIGTAFKF